MTFVPHTKNKRCFTACPEHKIKSGLCNCINRIKFKGNDNIDAVSVSGCDNCQDVQGMYLGITCPKCNRPFRDVKQTEH